VAGGFWLDRGYRAAERHKFRWLHRGRGLIDRGGVGTWGLFKVSAENAGTSMGIVSIAA
jgi:hypothetical protein